MMKNLFKIFCFIAVVFLLSNCASLTGFQDGRTVGKGNGEIYGSLNLSQSPDFNDWTDDNTDSFPELYFPNIEVGGSYGVSDRVDVGGRMNTNLNLSVNCKIQLIGTHESPFALAVSPSVGTFGLISGLWNFQLPVQMSVHPSESFTWYIAPRYVYQFWQYAGTANGLSYIGGNTGLLFGKRHKFGLDLSYHKLRADGEALSGLLSFGVGGRFALGNNGRD